MLVECATTSTNNDSLSCTSISISQSGSSNRGGGGSSSTTSIYSATSMSSTKAMIPSPPAIAPSSATTAGVVATTAASVNSTIVGGVPPNCSINNSSQDGLSSGSNSCSNSMSTTSNSNSIGTSWRVGGGGGSNSVGLECNGRYGGGSSIDKISNNDLRTDFNHMRSSDYSSTNATATGGSSGGSSSSSNKALHPLGGITSSYKYGSPLSDLKYFKKESPSSKVFDDINSSSKMVDVEACLANTPPHLLIRSLSSLSHHSSQLSTLPRSPEQEQVSFAQA